MYLSVDAGDLWNPRKRNAEKAGRRRERVRIAAERNGVPDRVLERGRLERAGDRFGDGEAVDVDLVDYH